LSTKIHAAGDALGNPLRLIGSPGQRNDIAFAHELVEGLVANAIIADKGYDADHLCDRIVWSRNEMARVDFEGGGVVRPGIADSLIGRSPSQRL
jgi:hypothetical protein